MRKRLELVQAAAFSLNLGYAVALTLTSLLITRPIGVARGGLESRNLFLQDLLSPEFRFLHPWVFPLALDAALTAFTLACSVVLLLVLRLMRGKFVHQVLHLVAGVSAITAVPLAWLSYNFIPLPWFSDGLPYPRLWLWLAPLYIAAFGGALYLCRRHPIPGWLIILGIHYIACALVLLRTKCCAEVGWYGLDLKWALVLSLVSPCSGVIWTFYVREFQ